MPTPPAKQNGNTSSKKEWIDQVQRDVKSDIGYINQSFDQAAVELYDECGDEVVYENVSVQQDLKTRTGKLQQLNTVSNNPRRGTLKQYTDMTPTNLKYDRTINVEHARAGYKLQELDALENEYTGQHHIGMYDTIERKDKETGKTVTGFLERNNYLDRI